jgi:hypothetical protein
MQPTLTPDFNFDNMPPAFFPEEALAVPDLPLARSAVKLPLVTVTPEPTATRKALRIVRAKTGETEMRLFAQDTEGEGIAYVIRTSTINPYKHDDKVLKKGENLMTEEQARATFNRLVAARYPAVVLRKNVTVPVHLDLL